MFALAGVYNLLFGFICIFFPSLIFETLGIQSPDYIALWQCIGLLIAIFGVGYLVVYGDPHKHWLVVLLGLMGKLGAALGFIYTQIAGTLPFEFIYLVIINDLIWIPFFALTLKATYQGYLDTLGAEALPLDESLRKFIVGGESLYELSYKKPLLLIFLRHAGCAFCRETLAALSKEKIDDMFTVVVHMGRDVDGNYLRDRFKLPWVSFVSDSDRVLYRSFGLRRGTLSQLFGPLVWLRGFNAAVIKGLGVGVIQGDGFQMPGAFIVHKGKVIYEERAASASDLPNFEKLLCVQPANEG